MPENLPSVVGDEILLPPGPTAEYRALGASWSARRGVWSVPAARTHASAIVDAGLATPAIRDALERPYAAVPDQRLYDYQRDAAGRLVAAPKGLLLCLSPGLGKTAVSVVAADQVVPAEEKILVIAPASLLRTWQREIALWRTVGGGETDVYIVRGEPEWELAAKARWIVASWDKLARDPALFGEGWPLIILDESVLAKSRGSKRFKSALKLRKSAGRVWLLSGSPVTRYADDLWAQLHLLWPKAFRSYWRFAERYCTVEETPWARVVTGTRSGRDAAEENSDLVLVVNQEDVLDLPEYLFEAVDVDLTPAQAKAYREMERDFITSLDGDEVIAANEIGKLGKLQQIVSWWEGSAKHDALLELLPQYEGPHLIWTHYREAAEHLTESLHAATPGVRHISGATPHAERDAILEDFKAGNLEALVLSIGVGKFGHTLTNAKTVWYVDKTWNADDYFQSLHRVRRIGLKHRPVVVTLRAPGTVDELVEQNLEGKLGGISRLTRARLRDLLAGLGKETQ